MGVVFEGPVLGLVKDRGLDRTGPIWDRTMVPVLVFSRSLQSGPIIFSQT